jgi:TatD DNase family protein
MPEPRYIDMHLHLAEPVLHDRLSDVLASARSAGLRRLVVNATGPDDWPVVARLAEDHPEITPFFGLHPWRVSEVGHDWPGELSRYLDSHLAGVGEIGLDRWIEPRDETAQREAFETQLDIARRRNVPACIHCLKAWGPLMDVLRPQEPFPAGLIIHACGASVEIMQELTEKNAWFSFAGDTLRTKYKTKRETFQAVDLDRLLVETDAPDMLPPSSFEPESIEADGQASNTPTNLPIIVAGLARLRDMTPEELARIAYRNSMKVLGPLAGDDG